MMGRSPVNTSGRTGASGYPHSVIRPEKQCRLISVFFTLTRFSGFPVARVGWVDSQVLNASM
jgi:hypothetical protein